MFSALKARPASKKHIPAILRHTRDLPGVDAQVQDAAAGLVDRADALADHDNVRKISVTTVTG